MNADPKQTRKKKRDRAAVAAVASAALLIPAGTAHGADRLSKKLNKKAVKAKIKHNIAVLKRRVRANPEAALRAQTPPEVSTGYGLPQRAPRRGRATTSQVPGSCSAKAGANWTYQGNNPPQTRVQMSWLNASGCTGKPASLALNQIFTDMIQPDGVHNPASAKGVTRTSLTGGAFGPKGTWHMHNIGSWTLPPPFLWGSAQGFCAGVGTSTVTCKYDYAFTP